MVHLLPPILILGAPKGGGVLFQGRRHNEVIPRDWKGRQTPPLDKGGVGAEIFLGRGLFGTNLCKKCFEGRGSLHGTGCATHIGTSPTIAPCNQPLPSIRFPEVHWGFAFRSVLAVYAVVDIVSALALPNGASDQSLSLQWPHLKLNSRWCLRSAKFWSNTPFPSAERWKSFPLKRAFSQPRIDRTRKTYSRENLASQDS